MFTQVTCRSLYLERYKLNKQDVASSSLISSPQSEKLILKVKASLAVSPDWAIYWTFGNFSKPQEQLICPKSFIFLVKSFLGNFYRHLAIFYQSHCSKVSTCCSRVQLWCEATAARWCGFVSQQQQRKLFFDSPTIRAGTR